MKFAMKSNRRDRLSQYDFDSPWCFPVSIEPGRAAPGIDKYDINRDSEDAEIPDWTWLRRTFSTYS
jgi:hypothetical protein